MRNVNQELKLDDFLGGANKKDLLQQKAKVVGMAALSTINGALYFVIAIEGAGNIRTFFHMDKDSGTAFIYSLSAGASLVYTMFTYKTLESLSLKINSLPKILFSLLAPFSAAAFLTAGKGGAEILNFGIVPALGIGITLFALRTINCIDASVKFPDRFSETKHAWVDAWHNRHYGELIRLIIVWFSSVGYAAATTDAVYSATHTILGWFGVGENLAMTTLCYSASALGALGTLPLNVYWSYRGLRQLTFGGGRNLDGTNPDPTDVYTYIGVILVIPVIFGILGGATASTGAVFGRLGIFSQVVRIATSVAYAIFAGTPGMATLLRSIEKYVRSFDCCKKNLETQPLLHDIDSAAGSSSFFAAPRKLESQNYIKIADEEEADVPSLNNELS